jgi:hypothetical protein
VAQLVQSLVATWFTHSKNHASPIPQVEVVAKPNQVSLCLNLKLVGTRDLRPARKGREKKKKKKNLVLTLGSPPEKGGKKKTLILTLGRSGTYIANPPEKGEKKKKKKTLVLTMGSSPDLDFRTWISGPGFQDLGLRTWVSRLKQTHATHPTVVSYFSHHFSLHPPSLFFFPSRSLCVQ